MQIVYDKHNEEYGVLEKKSFKDTIMDVSKNLKKNMPKMTPDHIFYTDKEIEVPKKEDLSDVPDIGIPTVHFYDSDKKVYDTAMYAGQNAYDRYEVIKEIKSLKEFFEFKKVKGAN
tara:strand:+ start:221 stop:568 length:348 start_codon:yes stop_codon:yes gene_type:complete